MAGNRSQKAGLEVGHNAVTPVPAVVGPLLGLLYIIILPLAGVVAIALLGGYRAVQGVALVWRRATQERLMQRRQHRR